MRSFFLKTAATASLAACCACAGAGGLSTVLSDYQQVKAAGKASTLLDIDNDTLLLTNHDGFYTSGVRLTLQYALTDATQATVFGWHIGQDQYTASDIKIPPQSLSPLDHPYAGWLYGGLFKDTQRADGTHTMFGLDIGCLGPCSGAGWAQTNFHKLLDQPLPQGWSTQVKNEVGAVLYADMSPVRWNLSPWLDATPDVHGRFGNIHTDAGAGLTVRAGRLNIFSTQPTLHGFVRIDGRAVGYDASLQGGYFSSGNPHTVAPKRLVGEAELGVVWNQGDYGINASVVRRTNEIRDLSNSIGAQSFARLQFSYTP